MFHRSILEFVYSFLPSSIGLDANLDTSKNHLFPTLEVNAKLHYITVIYGKRLRLSARLAESDVVEEGA